MSEDDFQPLPVSALDVKPIVNYGFNPNQNARVGNAVNFAEHDAPEGEVPFNPVSVDALNSPLARYPGAARAAGKPVVTPVKEAPPAHQGGEGFSAAIDTAVAKLREEFAIYVKEDNSDWDRINEVLARLNALPEQVNTLAREVSYLRAQYASLKTTAAVNDTAAAEVTKEKE